MRRRLLGVLAALGLAACSAETPAASTAALPNGAWMTAEGAGESALVFVPEGGGGEIAAVCSLGDPALFRIETSDAGFAAVANGTSADIVIGGLTAFEARLSRMPVDGERDLIQAATPITDALIAALQAGADLRLSTSAGAVQTGAVPASERAAFAAACAGLAGLTGP